jgi:hypothetical protein
VFSASGKGTQKVFSKYEECKELNVVSMSATPTTRLYVNAEGILFQ